MVFIFRESNPSKVIFFAVFDGLNEAICSFRKSNNPVFGSERVNYCVGWVCCFHGLNITDFEVGARKSLIKVSLDLKKI